MVMDTYWGIFLSYFFSLPLYGKYYKKKQYEKKYSNK